jgi:two-component system sensor histidine kinase HydH
MHAFFPFEKSISNRIVIYHSDPSQEGKSIGWKPVLIDEDQVETRVMTIQNGLKVYEIAKRFSPFTGSLNRPPYKETIGRESTEPPLANPEIIVVLGLNMKVFEDARRADMHHAMIMAGIVIALGSGVLFFIFVIQNYYLVDRTLKETQDYTRQVVASMANGLLSVNPEGKVLSYNLLALDLLGLEESEVRGMDLKEVIDFDTTGIQETLTESRSVLEREILHRNHSGETVQLALSVTPILDNNDSCRAAVIVLRDLREIKRLEEKVRRSEKLAAIGKLAAGVAHEIRNPLSSIRGFAQFLCHALADLPQEQEYARVMVNEVDRINRVVTDLITLARPLEASMVPTDMAELVDHTIRLVEADAQSRGVEIRTKISSDLGKLSLDNNQMTQALLNLLLNALQAVDVGGSIEVGIDVEAHDSQICIWVEDDGPGIDFEYREKIFDPFFTMREKGTGLGLAIVHRVVENHQGDITLESSPRGKSKGCRFTIKIPKDLRKTLSSLAEFQEGGLPSNE